MKLLKPTISKFLLALILVLIGIVLFIPFIAISPYWWATVACKNEFCGLLGNQSYTFFWVLLGIIWGDQSWNEYIFSPNEIFVSPIFYLLIPFSYFASSLMLSFIDNYAYVVPFVEDSEKKLLKTIYPSRKMTEKYIIKEKK